ncbi:hypothetical protein C8J56DRAFT_800214 [Mycena floridula]|nr:hypothetical protein C8J56DRAFT_800214 [Mycena floridula]
MLGSNTSSFLTIHLWELLKGWIHITDGDSFERRWTEITEALAPDSMVDCLSKTWRRSTCGLLSFCTSRLVWEVSDTNMLSFSRWHHILKGKFLEGKRSRRVDYLLHVLLDMVVPYYIARGRRQACVFEGHNLEVKKHCEVTE